MRSWTQLAHREPPYARWTVFLGRDTWAYSRGRSAGIPASLVPQSCALLKTVADVLVGPTYTALGGSALLLDVQVSELTARGLDHADLLALGVVRRTSPLSVVSDLFQAIPFSGRRGGRSECRGDVRM